MKDTIRIKKQGVQFIVLITLFFNFSCQNQQPLFTENADDWSAHGDASWKFEDNALVGTVNEGEGFVMTQQKYGDFVLELEFKPSSTINSGVFVRCSAVDISHTDCYEINIWDLHPDQKNRTGAIVMRSAPLAKVATNDQWNTYTIKVENNRVQAWVNGIKTADLEDDSLGEGYIGLQAKETGEVSFRNIQLKPL